MRSRIVPALGLLFLLPCALAISVCTLVVTLPVWVLMFPLILLSSHLHGRQLRKRITDGEDILEHVSSEEFSAAADVPGGLFRTIAALPLIPAVELWVAVFDLGSRILHPRLAERRSHLCA